MVLQKSLVVRDSLLVIDKTRTLGSTFVFLSHPGYANIRPVSEKVRAG